MLWHNDNEMILNVMKLKNERHNWNIQRDEDLKILVRLYGPKRFNRRENFSMN